ncbi:MAG: PBSX family phage terminase large subunit [Clostridia bacterium]|nr:PBSX family phage terminase large subunit [Clostridia bacterium]
MLNAIKLRERIKNGTVFKFKEFSKKQLKVLTWWTDESPMKDQDGIIADGAIRSGKTVSMSLSFVLWAMTKFNGQNFIMAGKTISAFRRNVLFWLKLMLKVQGYKIKDRRSDNLIEITKGEVINYFYIFGGKDERSQDLVQGITAAGVFLDEVALMPESFVNQATARCSVKGSKYWFNCNPEGPMHWFKVNWIDKCACNISAQDREKLEKENKIKNIIYLHFTMDDNLSLDEEVKARYRSMFVGVFFQRYILGLWVAAEGLIYPNFEKEKHIITENEVPAKMDAYYITSDYGITNPQVFLLCGIKYIKEKPHLYVLNEYYNVGDKNGKTTKTDMLFLKDYIEFTKGIEIRKTIIDPSATSLINLFKQNNIIVKEADNAVIDGINVVLNWLDEARIHIVGEKCPNIIKEILNYIWDKKAQERGEDKPIKINDHALDALRYILQTLFPIKRKGAYFYKSKENV